MELLRGETLKHYLAKAGGKGLAPDEVISFSQQAASALAAAPCKGIIHRDIKPANLFVVDAGRGKRLIKILDFGLAKKQAGLAVAESRTYGLPGNGSSDETAVGPGTATMELTSPGSAVGTVAYMSPEQAKGEPLDARTDLFSLGSVIYEMATGKTPFAGGSTAEVFAALLRGKSSSGKHGEPGDAEEAGSHRRQAAGQGSCSSLCDRRAAAGSARCDWTRNPARSTAAPAAGRNKSNWSWAVAAVLLLALVAGGVTWWKLRPAARPPAGESAAGSGARGNQGLHYPGRLHQPHR